MSFPMLIPVILLACSGTEPAPPPPPVVQPAPAAARDTADAAPKNRPPRIRSVLLEPTRPTSTDEIRAVVQAADPDGESVDVDYAWFINGERLLTQNRAALPPSAFQKGDVIKVEAIVTDDAAEVRQQSTELKVLNATPRFTSDPRSLRDLNGFTVKAEDPDDEPLTFSLEGAPKGMTIDPKAGTLSYEGSVDEPGGRYEITVVARDPDGAKAGWKFGIELSPGSAAAKQAEKK